MRSNVVLPQPDGPSSAKNSPGAMFSDTLSTARTPPKLFDTPAIDKEAPPALKPGRALSTLLGTSTIRPHPLRRYTERHERASHGKKTGKGQTAGSASVSVPGAPRNGWSINLRGAGP